MYARLERDEKEFVVNYDYGMYLDENDDNTEPNRIVGEMVVRWIEANKLTKLVVDMDEWDRHYNLEEFILKSGVKVPSEVADTEVRYAVTAVLRSLFSTVIAI
jgi:hypothetical protein